jgi:Cd(II)/Pb(II)-responsive transcriptional regulator
MKIGELAKIANCTVETIRYYEKEGLMLTPERQENNYRSYNQSHLERLRFIRNCRVLDLNHEEIRELLTLMEPQRGECQSVNDVLDEHLEHVRKRIKELQQLESQLMTLHTFCQRRCDEGKGDEMCGILQGLFELEYDAPTDLHTHDKRNYSHR